MNKILGATKELLGLPLDVTDFDTQLVMHINAVFLVLNQLGVGTDDPYIITLAEGDLEDFIEDESAHGLIQMYIYTKVRLVFDPPTTSFVLAALAESIKEYEWRLSDYSTS